MKVVTVCSHFPDNVDYYCHRAFFHSLAKWNYGSVVLGRDGYGGLGSKPRLLQQAIENGRITDNFIVFTDSWDVVFQQSPGLIQEQFNKGKLIFNAEKNLFPFDQKLADKFPESSTPYRYLNSGFSCGPTELYLQALKEMNALSIPDDYTDGAGVRHEVNDQTLWINQYLFGNTPISLDHNAELAQTLAGVSDDELILNETEPRLVKNALTGSTPVVVHLNGGFKEKWKPLILNFLGLPL